MSSKTASFRWDATLLGFAVLVLTGCSALPRALTPPQVELRELALVRAGVDRQDFRVGLLITNPNPLPIPVEALGFSVRLAGEGLLTGRSTTRMTLPAGGEELIRVEVSTDLLSSVRRLLAFVQGPEDAIAYELSGQLELDRRLGGRALPFSARGEVPLTATMGAP